MLRWIRFTTIPALLIGVLSLPLPSFAGKALYQTCVTNTDIVNATGFDAALQNNGDFYSWSGSTVTVKKDRQGYNICVPTGKQPDLFMDNNAAGQNSVSEKLKKNIAPKDKMRFSSIRDNGKSLDTTQSYFTANNQQIQTSFGNASITPRGDPILFVTNLGTDLMSLNEIAAQINNSSDPLSLATNFVPDGADVSVSLISGSFNLSQNETAEFSFDLPTGTRNWAFEAVYTVDGVTFNDLVAADVTPEPGSLLLLGTGLLGLAIVRRRKGGR